VKHSKAINIQRWRRTNRVRKKIRGTAECPRLSVFRSHKHIGCQLIDDETGETIVSASSRDKELAKRIKFGGNVEAARQVGAALAEKAKAAGVTAVRFDRGRYTYHGRVAGVADAAREAGLQF
jgi:large subunit ribosomal protein L18